MNGIMDAQTLILLLLSLSCGVLGWFARELYNAVNKLREDLSALRVLIAEDYVRYDRLQEALKPILQGIQEIKESLGHKADKDTVNRKVDADWCERKHP